MAHRLTSSWSPKCRNLHGHSYVCEVFLGAETLDENGMVMDFGAIKQMLDTVMDIFDHKTVIHDKDCLRDVLPAEESYITDYNPTAENMVFDIAIFVACNLQKDNVCEIKVRLHETETGWAEYTMNKEEINKYRKGL